MVLVSLKPLNSCKYVSTLQWSHLYVVYFIAYYYYKKYFTNRLIYRPKYTANAITHLLFSNVAKYNAYLIATHFANNSVC